ncbi:MAG: hypothetical protein PHC53_05980 [Patescibacteria group bacterium]|nr:hypothetical protein [Patescibacteria group bacterium]
MKPKEEIMSTLKDFTKAVAAFNRRFEQLGPQLMVQDLFHLEAQLRRDLAKSFVKSQGMDPASEWHRVEEFPLNTVLSAETEGILQNYLELIRMNFGVRAGKMDTFRDVQQVYGGLQGYALAGSLPPAVKQESDLILRALCIQLAYDNKMDPVQIQSQFMLLPEDLVLTLQAKALADRFFTLIETIFSPSG